MAKNTLNSVASEFTPGHYILILQTGTPSAVLSLRYCLRFGIRHALHVLTLTVVL